MLTLTIWIIATTVVATNERPAVVLRSVLITAMERIGVEEQSVARLHFDVYQFESLRRGGHALRVCAGLIAGFHVCDTTHRVRAAQYLQATVLARRRIDSD